MCTKCSIDVDLQTEFGEKLFGMVSGGMLTLMMSIGHRAGLFDKMEDSKPLTSNELAEAAGLNERYVREWLGAMTTGGIVILDEDGERYLLPREHANLLCRTAGSDNMAVFMQFLSVLGSVEGKIVDCFKNGGGLHYSEYDRFHNVMAEESGNTVLNAMEDHILPMVDGLEKNLEVGIKVLDAGCGSGKALNYLARKYPNSQFTGYDLCDEALQVGRAEAAEFGLANIEFIQRDLSTFHQDAPESEFDFITTFDSVHDQARPDHLLAGIKRALKSNGVYLMQDIRAESKVSENMENPLAPFLYTISCMHCMSVSLAQGGMGLGAVWGRGLAKEMLREAGFGKVEINELEHDPMNDYYVCR